MSHISFKQILFFLTPSEGDAFQWGILISIVFLVAYTVSGVLRKAKEKYWEANWNQGVSGGGSLHIDTDHGSVHDISEVVATREERLANVLPGILLVIGLLGTFIGLGIAIDSAASVVKSGNMNDMSSMVEGLGTKFKSSAWGIIGFLLFRWWSGFYDYEGRRLGWCIKRVRKQLDSLRKAELAKSNESIERIIIAIKSIPSQLKTNAAESQASLRKLSDLIRAQGESLQSLQTGFTQFLDANTSNMDSMSKASKLVGESAGKLSDAIGLLNKELKASIEVMNSDLKNSLDLVSGKMISASEGVKTSAEDLGKTVNTLEGSIVQVLNGVNSSLTDSVERMNRGFQESMALVSDRLGVSAEKISEAVTKFGDVVPDAMGEVRDAIKQSVEIQVRTTRKFEEASLSLRAAVDSMTQNMDSLGGDIKLGLRAISENNLQSQAIAEQIRGVAKESMFVTQGMESKLSSVADLLTEVATKIEGNNQHVGEASDKLVKISELQVATVRNLLRETKQAVDSLPLISQKLDAILSAGEPLEIKISGVMSMLSGFDSVGERVCKQLEEIQLAISGYKEKGYEAGEGA